ncbi:winged helix-turn-helix domain-containing protein [Pseudomonas sp.]|uniref:winged helix-turn-helix domain-containing protein n=1 Tax=Pseudomonas sp. TaxID=306 RepID=UPI003D0C2100
MTTSLTRKANDANVCTILKTGREACHARFDPRLYQLLLCSGTGEEQIDLGFSGSRVLERLLQTPGEVVSREELLRHAWEKRVVSQGSLNQQIYTLRQVLFDDANQIIQTLPRRGYLFNPHYLATTGAPDTAPLVPPSDEPASAAPAPMDTPRSPWLSPLLLGTTMMLLLAVATLGYRFLYAPKGSLTHIQTVGQLEVLYVEKSQRMLDRMMMETRLLMASIAGLSRRPGRLIVNMSPGFYEIRCLHKDGRINWLKVHKSQLNAIPNETLQGCLQ